jgi:outer membrane receptor protein involved in Fe transport
LYWQCRQQSTTGLEMEGMWQPSDAWKPTLLPRFRIRSMTFVGPRGGPVDLSGTTPPGITRSPLIRRQPIFDLGSTQSLFVAIHLCGQGTVIENVLRKSPRKVSTFNGSLGFGWSNGLELIIWGRNLFNDEYLLSAFPSVAQLGSYSGYPNQPRTFGVTLSSTF